MPEAYLIRTFNIRQVAGLSVRWFLKGKFSLGICCRDCSRLSEWTPPELEEKFAGKLDLPVAEIVKRLACTGEGGCGSHSVAVFPHLYDLPYTPPVSH
jgi:hypothetical protein